MLRSRLDEAFISRPTSCLCQRYQRRNDGKTLLILFPQGILHAAQELSSLGHKNEVLHLLGNKLPIAISPEFVTEWFFPSAFSILMASPKPRAISNIEHSTRTLSRSDIPVTKISVLLLLSVCQVFGEEDETRIRGLTVRALHRNRHRRY